MAHWLNHTIWFLAVAQHELLLFALVWMVIGMVDETAVDLLWLGLRLFRGGSPVIEPDDRRVRLSGPVAVLIPAWHEAEVIGATINHLLKAWPQREYRLYVGCYCNDPATIGAVIAAAGGDARLRLVVHPRLGPTTKADCLNRLYGAVIDDEARIGRHYRGVVLHDAEDMVHPMGLDLIDRSWAEADFVQLPVRPELPPGGGWVAAHYADEFAESHAKAMVLRDSLGVSLPAAGVGCGFTREILEKIGAIRREAGEIGPFAADCLTEDYELGVMIARLGGRARFLRRRDVHGGLIATRSYFPATLPEAVRQKTRWLHGIAFQGWDRLGWHGGPLEWWMTMRDRKGPLVALVLAAAYLLLCVDAALALLRLTMHGHGVPLPPPSPALQWLLRLSFAGLVWRLLFRTVFTANEYGRAEALPALARLPLGNIIAIMAGRRALAAYIASLAGAAIHWDKTAHRLHRTAARRRPT